MTDGDSARPSENGGESENVGESETGGASSRRPAFGGQRPADATTSPASDAPTGDADEVGSVVEESRGTVSEGVDPAAGADPLAVATRERDDFKDALVRLQADFENYKKRMIKQQTDHLERAAQTLVEKLLPVLDTADLALAHGGGEDIKQVTSALAGVLEREGLERIDPIGGRFDPTLHDAVAHEPGEGDGDEQEVVEVLRAGYRWKGRVLRPAMVKVKG